MNSIQESITVYSPNPYGRQFIIYTRSKMVSSHDELGLKVGDAICVTITSYSQAEAHEIVGALMTRKITIITKTGPLDQTTDKKGSPEYKIKALDTTIQKKNEDE